MFQCIICNVFSTDSLKNLQIHLQLDRTKHGNEDHVALVSGRHRCQLCAYNTGLKANFQLHCKTDKHLQRLQLINHIREGVTKPGSENVDMQAKYLQSMSNPVQVRCNACNFFANSVHKLQLHVTSSHHELAARLYDFLLKQELALPAAGSAPKSFRCEACDCAWQNKMALMEHVTSVTHFRNEQMLLAKRKQNGGPEVGGQFSLGDVFSVQYQNESDKQQRSPTEGE